MAAATDQAVADLLADINALAVSIDTTEAELAALPDTLAQMITDWAQQEQVRGSRWNTLELQRIAQFKAQLTLIVSTYVNNLRKHLSALAPDATHNGQSNPSEPVTQFPEWFKVRTNRYSAFPQAGKVPGTWQEGFAGREETSTANSSPALCSTASPIAPGATVVGVASTMAMTPYVVAPKDTNGSAVTVTVTSNRSALLTVRYGDTTQVTGGSKDFEVEPDVALFATVRMAKDGEDTFWTYFRVEIKNTDETQSAEITVTTDKAREADPSICFRPLFSGFTREECPVPKRYHKDATYDRYIVGQPMGKQNHGNIYPRTTWWACTPFNVPSKYIVGTYPTGTSTSNGAGGLPINPAYSPYGYVKVNGFTSSFFITNGGPSTTGAVEYAATSYSIRLDAPAQGCNAIENRMFVPIYPNGAQTPQG